MALKLYNTFSKKLEEFKPLKQGLVTMYNCGPTVYEHPHIGNFRSFLFADILRRYLEFKGYNVKQIMNITDVGHLTMDDVEQGEDKLAAAARKKKMDPWELAKIYTDEFFSLMQTLNVKKAGMYPRATEHIEEMKEAISKLIERGYAYATDEGVYYRISKFADYGKLSGNTVDKLIAGKRIPKNPKKESPLDFALWKVDPKHIMKWPSDWGEGFPGWHIECSVMGNKYLGDTIDIHTGGEDNIFPHHESEIAQAEAYNDGKRFVRFWLHVRHLLVSGTKMSKSLGNFYEVRDIFGQGYKPRALRYLLISAHYRTNFNFTFDALESSGSACEKLVNLRDFLSEVISANKEDALDVNEARQKAGSMLKGFEESMDDDLNVSRALGCVFEFVSDINKQLSGIGRESALIYMDAISRVDSVIGCMYGVERKELTEEQNKLIEEREAARKNSDFRLADEIRDKLKRQGVELTDSKDGIKWKIV